MAELTLVGFRYSVYTRIVRMALWEMSLTADYYVEADPFADPPDPVLAGYTPFDRVPVLCDGAFVLTETAAILRYLDLSGTGPTHVPAAPKAVARMAQVIGIADAYCYPTMVRQVFSHGYYRPKFAEAHDPAEVRRGLDAVAPALRTLNDIAREGLVLDGTITLGDLQLAPMIACFVMTDAGANALARYPALAGWWDGIRDRESLRATDPFAAGRQRSETLASPSQRR